MGNIKDKVAIVGMGLTKFGDRWDVNIDELIADAAYEAYADAGIEPSDIQAAWVGTLFSGNTGCCLARPLKLPWIPITRVENGCGTGMDAFRNACFGVVSGMYDTVLVVGFEKLKDFGTNILQGFGLGAHPVFGWGVTSPGDFALAATRYFHEYGIGRETLAKIDVKNHYNGSLHPKAQLRRPITVEQALNAPLVAWPLGLFDCCPRSDGAAAAVITRADMAKSFRDDYVLVKGLGVAASPGNGRLRQDYDFLHFDENVAAAKQVYEQVGIKNPLKELSLAEVHDCFSITELLICEDLEFCPRGQAKEYIDNGVFDLTGELPVNPDGGLKSFGHPQGASGLRMIYEIYKQLQGKAEEPKRQLKNVELGLAHNIGGVPSEGTTSTITILGH